MFSSVFPAMTECTPQELLPTMPPRVQRLCEAGSGPKVRLCFSAAARKMVKNNPGLDTRDAAIRIKLDNLCHVLREVEHDGDVAALPGQRSPSAAAEHRRAVLAANGDGGDYIVGIFGKDNADGDLAVVGTVGGVEGSAAVVEANLATKMAAQRGFQRLGVNPRMSG